MVSPSPTEERRRLLLSAIAQKRGYYPPPQPSQATNEPAVTKQKESSGFMKAAKSVLGPVFSGSKFVDLIAPGEPGTAAKEFVADIPVIGRPTAEILDSLLSPFTVATLGYGGVAGAALRGTAATQATGGFSRLLAPVVEPLVTGSLKARVGAELGAQIGARGASELAERAGLPEPIQLAAGLVGGIGGVRTAANIRDFSRRTAGGLLAEEIDAKLATGDSVDKLTALLSKATVKREDLAAIRKQEMGARLGSIRSNLTETMGAEQRAKTIFAGLQGARPTAELPIPAEINDTDIKAIIERTSNFFKGQGDELSEARAYGALKGMFFENRLPQPNEIATLSEALGPDFGRVLSNLSDPRKLTSFKTAMEVMGIPRAVMASGDLSMPFRQGILGISRKSYWRSWAPMVNAFKDENVAKEALRQVEIDPHPMSRLLKDKNMLTLPASARTGLARTEEQFTSELADIFPGVKQSQRAALTFLNKFRNDYAKGIYDDWTKKGVEISPKMMDDLAEWTGTITGRSHLPMDAGRFGEMMNTLFFSPKMMYARLRALNPMTYARMDPMVRKEAARDMVGFFAPAMTAVGMAGLAAKAGLVPGLSVEADPRSSDFGRIKFGQSRIDLWGGFQPYARYIAQLATGQGKNSYGDITARDRDATLGNFTRGKLAPIPSFLVDAFMGTNYIGEEVDVGGGVGLDRAAAERLVPMFAQDITDAFKVGGYLNASLALPSFFGVTVQSYNSAAAIQQAGAQEMYNKPWTDLTGIERAAVKEAYKDQLAQQNAPASNSLTAYIERINDDTRAAEQKLLDGLNSGGSNQQFNEAMSDLMSQRYNMIKGARGLAKVDEGTEPDLLDRYFGLSEMAKTNGVLDYQKLDQLQADFMDQLTPDDRRIIDERASFAHIPSVQWWADSKRKIADSGYYRIQGETMQRLDPLVQRIAPGAGTYMELVSRVNTAESPAQAAVLSNLVRRIDQLTRKQQQAFRLKNAEVDNALTLVYGSTPIIAQLART